MTKYQWRKAILNDLRVEARRLLERIDEADNEYSLNLYQSKGISAIKRATLDLNRVGVKLRKGYYNKD